MTEREELRASGIERIKLATLVEICGNEPGIPAFEAESIDVSGRGMGVKTAFVPEIGAPLVMRFENEGREIIVEGEVAWRREAGEQGQFGIQFTALDSGSVEALRDLSQTQSDEVEDASEPNMEREKLATPGSKVRLYIEGLNTPMKACVREGSHRKVNVGSNLEFLKVGRRLELEDPEGQERKGATIDGVTLAIDPQSSVPQLVVTLRYEGVDRTPEPSVVDPTPAQTGKAPSTPTPTRSAEVASVLGERHAVAERLEGAAEQAAILARDAKSAISEVGRSAAVGAGRLLRGAAKQFAGIRAMRAMRAQAPQPRRTTSMPRSGALSQAMPRLRQQGAPSQAPIPANPTAAPPASRKRARRVAIGLLLVASAGGSAAYVLRHTDSPAAQKTALEAVPEGIAAKPEKVASASKKPKAAAPGPSKTKNGIVADVPLFGPTPMATMEPAPREAPDGESEEEREKAAAAASVPDQSWSGEKVRPEDVKPWGRGRMHLPTIHRLRLDAPGASVKGAVTSTGFTVVIPGRKVTESGRAISRRDQRIVKVKTSNKAVGAEITFQFRKDIPPYRVRLRKDAVEFLISAPE